jgi:hypothetical protein
MTEQRPLLAFIAMPLVHSSASAYCCNGISNLSKTTIDSKSPSSVLMAIPFLKLFFI